MRINDLENRTGLDRATIRYYEKEGLLTPRRLENGYRDYTDHDADFLKKVKLLRQLGMTLEQIKNLERGEADFDEVLRIQLGVLSKDINQKQRAREVCGKIRSDKADYATLDAELYLKELFRPAEQSSVIVPSRTFRESVRRERHPVRRFVARILDYELFQGLIFVVLFFVLRIRPMSSVPMTLLSYLIPLFFVPLEAVLICCFGTTPGKFVMGIKVEYENGGKMPFHAAMSRSFWAYRLGYGWNIPFWRLWRLYKSYREHMEDVDMPWENESEITYKTWDRKRIALLVAAIAVYAGMIAIPAYDSVLPTYRGDITVEQFAENYRDYEELLQRSFVVQMQDDGTWCQEMPEDNPHIVFVELDGTASHEIPDLIYTTEDGVVTGISFQDELNGFRYASVFPGYLKMVAITFMASQPGMTVPELDAWEEQLRYNSINNQEFNELSIEYCGVRLYWSCEAENASITSNGSAIASNKTEELDEKTDASVKITFKIERIETK